MRRMVKEEMLRFDGTRLFPERRAYTASYRLSPPEAALYATVTKYVTEEQALHLRKSNQDRKWDELSTLLQETPVMRDAEGNQRKLIIFTEHSVKGGGRVGQCGGVKAGHFWHEKVLGVAGSVASGA